MTMMQPHWRKLSGAPTVVEGYEFAPYSIGIGRSQHYCPELDAAIRERVNSRGLTVTGAYWYATVKGDPVLSPRTGKTHKFRSSLSAATAAVRKAKEGATP